MLGEGQRHPPAAQRASLFEGEEANLETQPPFSPSFWQAGFLASACESDGESKSERGARVADPVGSAGRPLQMAGTLSTRARAREWTRPEECLNTGQLQGRVGGSLLRGDFFREGACRQGGGSAENCRMDSTQRTLSSFSEAGRMTTRSFASIKSISTQPTLAPVKEDGGFAEAAERVAEEEVCGWGDKGWVGECAGLKLTSVDACRGKMSSVLFGYYKDPFLRFFVNEPLRMLPIMNRGEEGGKEETGRRRNERNRQTGQGSFSTRVVAFTGYYTRVEALRRLLERFLLDARDFVFARESGKTQSAKEKDLNSKDAVPDSGDLTHPIAQVVNFGAGADTTCFILGVKFYALLSEKSRSFPGSGSTSAKTWSVSTALAESESL